MSLFIYEAVHLQDEFLHVQLVHMYVPVWTDTTKLPLEKVTPIYVPPLFPHFLVNAMYEQTF